MKILIATDIHGSAYYAEQVALKLKQNNCEQLILLGDVYNHGPRNPFPKDYAPAQVAEIFNAIADKVISVKGNCDSEVDQMISDFPFVEQHIMTLGERRLYFTHGHVYSKFNLPQTAKQGDVVFYGHFHINEITQNDGVICVNVGSTSLPKDECHAYCILDDDVIRLCDFNDNVIAEHTLD